MNLIANDKFKLRLQIEMHLNQHHH